MLTTLSSGSNFQSNPVGWSPRVSGVNAWVPWMNSGLVLSRFYGANRPAGMSQGFNFGLDSGDGTLGGAGALTVNPHSLLLGSPALTTGTRDQTNLTEAALPSFTIYMVVKLWQAMGAAVLLGGGSLTVTDPIGGSVLSQSLALKVNASTPNQLWLSVPYNNPTTGAASSLATAQFTIASTATTQAAAPFVLIAARCNNAAASTQLRIQDLTNGLSATSGWTTSSTAARDTRYTNPLTLGSGYGGGSTTTANVLETAAVQVFNVCHTDAQVATMAAKFRAWQARRAAYINTI